MQGCIGRRAFGVLGLGLFGDIGAVASSFIVEGSWEVITDINNIHGLNPINPISMETLYKPYINPINPIKAL